MTTGELFAGEEFEVDDVVFVRRDFIGREIEEVDDAEVDGTDLGGVVVDEADDGLGVLGVEIEFFVDFALDPCEVGIFLQARGLLVFRVDMAADADGAF